MFGDDFDGVSCASTDEPSDDESLFSADSSVGRMEDSTEASEPDTPRSGD